MTPSRLDHNDPGYRKLIISGEHLLVMAKLLEPYEGRLLEPEEVIEKLAQVLPQFEARKLNVN